MSEVKYAVMDDLNHIYATFPSRNEAIAYRDSGREWVKHCRVVRIICESPPKEELHDQQ